MLLSVRGCWGLLAGDAGRWQVLGVVVEQENA